MAFRESLEFYLNFSRKELQCLCKKHNLPANRSQVQLAKSLASISKKKNVKASSSKEASFSISPLPESKHRETACPPEGTTRGVGTFERRITSCESDNYWLASSIKEIVGDGRPRSQTGNQLELNNHMDSRSLKKVYDADAEVVCPYPIPSGAIEGFGYSTSELEGAGIRPSVAPDIQENKTILHLGLECHASVTRSETQKSSPLRVSSQKVPNLATLNSEPSIFTLVPSKHQRIVGCSTESGFASSDEILTRPVPTFQFFVSSEEGIHLYVDLNSSPSEWINSLNDEVSITQKSHHKLGTTSNQISGLPEVGEHMKISSSRIGVDLQSDGVERNAGCTNSSLSSVVSENCHSEEYAPDATAVTSRSSLLTSSSVPVEILGCLNENRVVSSSCIPFSNIRHRMTFDVASSLGDGEVLPQDSVEASLMLEKNNA